MKVRTICLTTTGLKHLTNYNKNTPATVRADASLAEELNLFFAHFEVKRPPTVPLPPLTTNQQTATPQEDQVS